MSSISMGRKMEFMVTISRLLMEPDAPLEDIVDFKANFESWCMLIQGSGQYRYEGRNIHFDLVVRGSNMHKDGTILAVSEENVDMFHKAGISTGFLERRRPRGVRV